MLQNFCPKRSLESMFEMNYPQHPLLNATQKVSLQQFLRKFEIDSNDGERITLAKTTVMDEKVVVDWNGDKIEILVKTNLNSVYLRFSFQAAKESLCKLSHMLIFCYLKILTGTSLNYHVK